MMPTVPAKMRSRSSSAVGGASVISLSSLFSAASPAFAAAPVRVAAAPVRVEYESGANSAHVLAFDNEDEVAAEVVLWHTGDGKLRLDAAFPDGLIASAEVVDGVVIMSEDPDLAAAGSRRSKISSPPRKHRWGLHSRVHSAFL